MAEEKTGNLIENEFRLPVLHFIDVKKSILKFNS